MTLEVAQHLPRCVGGDTVTGVIESPVAVLLPCETLLTSAKACLEECCKRF